jgi:hypothetical protein
MWSILVQALLDNLKGVFKAIRTDRMAASLLASWIMCGFFVKMNMDVSRENNVLNQTLVNSKDSCNSLTQRLQNKYENKLQQEIDELTQKEKIVDSLITDQRIRIQFYNQTKN